MRKIKIDVTPEDIEDAERCNALKCPIVRATLRAIKDKDTDCQSVSVSGSYIYLWSLQFGTLVYTAKLPHHASRFVRQLDKHGKTSVAPISFTAEFYTVN